jgi:fructose-1,6-bisphosphatase I
MSDALQPGENQLASGFFVYGPQTSLILTTGSGVASFILKQGEFIQMEWEPSIPNAGNQFAINISNMRYWSQPATDYIQACLDGVDGPFAKNYNMRWCGSLVADAWRIFRQGGIFLYPEDSRENYHVGRLRLIYEANPVAFLVEQAGGRATDGNVEILKIEPKAIHQRVPLIFGSKDDVFNYESLY